MSERTEHPPSAEGSTRGTVVRRSVIGGVVGAALLVGPVALANVIVPDDRGGDVEAAAPQVAFVDWRPAKMESEDSVMRTFRKVPTTTTSTTTTTTTTTTTVPPTTTTTVPPTTAPPEVAPPDSGGGLGDPNSYATWDALAQCESGGNWHINTGNGYYGGLQFSLSSWQAVGGTGYPHEHSRETQILMGQRLQARQGWGAWPACTRKLGFR